MDSLDTAVEYLNGLINGTDKGFSKDYASNIDSATRFVHLQVGDLGPTRKRVKEDLIPLLEKAYASLPEKGKNCKYDNHVKEQIQGRICSLKRYCRGLMSCWTFPKPRKKQN